MKTIIINKYGGPEVLEYVEMADHQPGADEVTIRVKAASVNPVDWKIRQGKLKFITGSKFPLKLGAEVAGVIEKTGEKVQGLEPGQRVFGGMSYRGGGYSDLALTKAGRVITLDDSISFEAGSTFAVAGMTPLQALKDMSKTGPGKKVLINGASGGVGIYAVQIAKIMGAEVTAVCSTKNIEFVRSLGADHILDYSITDFRKQDKRYDLIIDAANNCTLREVRKVLRPRGILIKLNNSIPTILLNFLTFLLPGKKVKLLLLRNSKENLEWIRDHVADGSLKVIIDRTYPLHKAEDAHRYSETLRATGKIVLIPE